MTLFLTIFSIVGWAIALGALVLLGLLSIVFSVQEARLNEIKGDLEVMIRRANLFEPKGEREDI
jgi:hypothetical protein